MSLETDLRTVIGSHLEMCDKVNTPYVCMNCSTDEGKKMMVESVYNIVVDGGLEVGQAIIEREKEMNPNIPD